VGWSRCQGVPYHQAIGVAASHDGGTHFTRLGDGPVLTRSVNEPYVHNSPYVFKVGDVFHMVYSAGIDWKPHGGRLESIYVLMQATSSDGVHWQRTGRPVMPAKLEDECQNCPTILQINGRYHMWFCYRHGLDFRNAQRSYRMGYAWSVDLVTWHRDDDASLLEPSASGWDSEMVCYPAVFTLDDGGTYMFYCGNGFGRDGFGMAVLER
jgi:predicted GH43/DUF377 family glycosyl hydrolase